jgi:hypothetical protein
MYALPGVDVQVCGCLNRRTASSGCSFCQFPALSLPKRLESGAPRFVLKDFGTSPLGPSED